MTITAKVRLTDYDDRMLERMAQHMGVTRSDIIRIAIRRLNLGLKKNGWELDLARPSEEPSESEGHHQRKH